MRGIRGPKFEGQECGSNWGICCVGRQSLILSQYLTVERVVFIDMPTVDGTRAQSLHDCDRSQHRRKGLKSCSSLRPQHVSNEQPVWFKLPTRLSVELGMTKHYYSFCSTVVLPKLLLVRKVAKLAKSFAVPLRVGEDF